MNRARVLIAWSFLISSFAPACVVPFEHEADLAMVGLRKVDDNRFVFAGGANAGVGLGCRGRPWSGVIRAGVMGGRDVATGRSLLALRFGPAAHYQMGPLLATGTLVAGPVIMNEGGGGGQLALGLGARLGPHYTPGKYRRSHWLVLEGVLDARGVDAVNAADGLLVGLRIRYLHRRQPRCFGPPPPIPERVEPTSESDEL